jgi:predicted cupin superfamily sugar epimerase
VSELSPQSAATLVEQLGLAPHPEGGWFREVHRSHQQVQRTDGRARCGLTLIWFLLTEQDISRWHRVVGADETWHHAGGAPLELWILPPAGGVAERRLLGPLGAPGEGAQPVQVVPADWWQAARPMGEWSLVTCCVGPGFDFEDFQLLHHWPVAAHPAGALPDFL